MKTKLYCYTLCFACSLSPIIMTQLSSLHQYIVPGITGSGLSGRSIVLFVGSFSEGYYNWSCWLYTLWHVLSRLALEVGHVDFSIEMKLLTSPWLLMVGLEFNYFQLKSHLFFIFTPLHDGGFYFNELVQRSNLISLCTWCSHQPYPLFSV